MNRLYTSALPWMIGILLPLAAVGRWWLYIHDTSDLAKPAMFAGTILGIWVACLSAYVTLLNSQHQALTEIQRHFFSSKPIHALKEHGPIYNQEFTDICSGNWTIQNNVGVRYISLIESDEDLHESRRELSGLYESLCSQVVQGIMTRNMIISMFPNLIERAAWITVVEEMLALKISCTRFTYIEIEAFVKAWNTSRKRYWPVYHNIEVGKPNMRTFARMRLHLINDGPSLCDYKNRVFQLNIKDIFQSEVQDKNTPLTLKIESQE